jgi:PAS domain S-box-containing protein
MRGENNLHAASDRSFNAGIALRIEGKEKMPFESNDQSEVGVAIVSMDHTLAWVSPAFAQIIGRMPSELRGQTFESITHEDDVDLDHDLANRLFCGEIEKYEMEKRYIHRDGSIVPIHLVAALVRDRHGNVLYAVSTVEKISHPDVYRVIASGPLTDNELELDRIRRAVLND